MLKIWLLTKGVLCSFDHIWLYEYCFINNQAVSLLLKLLHLKSRSKRIHELNRPKVVMSVCGNFKWWKVVFGRLMLLMQVWCKSDASLMYVQSRNLFHDRPRRRAWKSSEGKKAKNDVSQFTRSTFYFELSRVWQSTDRKRTKRNVKHQRFSNIPTNLNRIQELTRQLNKKEDHQTHVSQYIPKWFLIHPLFHRVR